MDGSTVAVVVIVGAVVLVGVLVAVLRVRKDSRRQTQFAAWAAGRGWSHVAEDPALVAELGGPVFEQGHGQRTVNVARGQAGGFEAVVADFRHTTTKHGNEGADVDKIHRTSVVSLDLARPLPHLTVEPQRAGGRLLGKLAGSRLEVGDPAFDKAFKVTAFDEAAARAVLTPDVCRVALEHPRTPWMLHGHRLVSWSEGEQEPAEAEMVLAVLEALAARLPR